MTIPDDLAALSEAELYDLTRAVASEQERRRIPARIDSLIRDSLGFEGVSDGDPWRQPGGAYNAYPEGWTVTDDGKTWVSLTPANVWQPPVNWRQVTDDGAPPAWVQPTGAQDAYNTGNRVTFNGQVYESKIDANTWSPADYPAGWKQIV